MSDKQVAYQAAWLDRKQRMAVFKTVQIAGLAWMFLGFLFAWYHPSFGPFAIIGSAIWFLAYITAGIWLNWFQCPRCRKLYYWRLEWKGYMERQRNWRDCRHCGLKQDTMPA